MHARSHTHTNTKWLLSVAVIIIIILLVYSPLLRYHSFVYFRYLDHVAMPSAKWRESKFSIFIYVLAVSFSLLRKNVRLIFFGCSSSYSISFLYSFRSLFLELFCSVWIGSGTTYITLVISRSLPILCQYKTNQHLKTLDNVVCWYWRRWVDESMTMAFDSFRSCAVAIAIVVGRVILFWSLHNYILLELFICLLIH